jgi:outer membrane protein OmpA-like peptidoglycan-associated protein
MKAASSLDFSNLCSQQSNAFVDALIHLNSPGAHRALAFLTVPLASPRILALDALYPLGSTSNRRFQDMRFRAAAFCIAMAVGLTPLNATAQNDNSSSPIYLFSKAEAEFDQAVKEVLFPWNDHDTTTDQSALQENVQWLKEHPKIYFYVDGYASTRGELIYNLALSLRRANFIKQQLIASGIPEERILLAVGWGQLYPVCPEQNEECWSKNRRVRLKYAHE